LCGFPTFYYNYRAWYCFYEFLQDWVHEKDQQQQQESQQRWETIALESKPLDSGNPSIGALYLTVDVALCCAAAEGLE
jgi:hypothetical protein